MTTHTHYEANAARLDRAHDDVDAWCHYQDPEEVRRMISSHLLGQLMNRVDPDTFARMVQSAEWFSGRPHDEDEQ